MQHTPNYVSIFNFISLVLILYLFNSVFSLSAFPQGSYTQECSLEPLCYYQEDIFLLRRILSPIHYSIMEVFTC